MILDTNYWLTYLSGKSVIDSEFSIVQKNALTLGNKLPTDTYVVGCSCLDLFFKNARLRILYGGVKDITWSQTDNFDAAILL